MNASPLPSAGQWAAGGNDTTRSGDIELVAASLRELGARLNDADIVSAA